MPVKLRIKAKRKVAQAINRPAQTDKALDKTVVTIRSVEQIIEAVQSLKGPQLDRVRRKIEELEEARWQRGRRAAARRMAARGIKDAEIDEMVIRSRRESRR